METDRRIAYFAGCTANYVEPEIGEATVRILQKNGFRLLFPVQRCCAIPQLLYGNLRSFLRHAEFNVRSLAEAGCDIVTACTSCALVLKRDYPRLLGSQEAEMVSRRAYDIMEYLAMLGASNAFNTDFQPVARSILYHAPCHLKVLGRELIDSRLELMGLIPGLSVSRVDRGCCGMGGTFGVKRSNYTRSMTIGRPLFEEVRRLAPDLVATECPGCELQIEQGTGAAVTHPILIMKEAYGL